MLKLVQIYRGNSCCPKDIKDWIHKELAGQRARVEWNNKSSFIFFSAKCFDITKNQDPEYCMAFQLRYWADSSLLTHAVAQKISWIKSLCGDIFKWALTFRENPQWKENKPLHFLGLVCRTWISFLRHVQWPLWSFLTPCDSSGS